MNFDRAVVKVKELEGVGGLETESGQRLFQHPLFLLVESHRHYFPLAAPRGRHHGVLALNHASCGRSVRVTLLVGWSLCLLVFMSACLPVCLFDRPIDLSVDLSVFFFFVLRGTNCYRSRFLTAVTTPFTTS